ncbi:hypothetical protein EDD21DRAFT_205621 [Dissophora ornata]|nr:hypothetical protein EDD21DRAFT_205621 [Dissophora ornata]
MVRNGAPAICGCPRFSTYVLCLVCCRLDGDGVAEKGVWMEEAKGIRASISALSKKTEWLFEVCATCWTPGAENDLLFLEGQFLKRTPSYFFQLFLMAPNLNGDRIVYFAAGMSLVFMMYSVVRHATALFDSEPPESRNILSIVEDKISMEALAKLARSDSIVLQGSSVRILLSRAMREPNLRYILDTIADSDIEEERWKGVTTLQLLTRNVIERLLWRLARSRFL